MIARCPLEVTEISPPTDILTWKLRVFGDEPDDLVRQIVALGEARELESPTYNLTGSDPRYFPNVDVEGLTGKLRALGDGSESRRSNVGWEVE